MASARSTRPSALRRQPQPGRRLFAVVRMAARRDLDPAVHALLAFLHDREVDRLPGLEIVRERADEYELIVLAVGQLAGRPGNLSDTFAERHAVRQIVRL